MGEMKMKYITPEMIIMAIKTEEIMKPSGEADENDNVSGLPIYGEDVRIDPFN